MRPQALAFAFPLVAEVLALASEVGPVPALAAEVLALAAGILVRKVSAEEVPDVAGRRKANAGIKVRGPSCASG